MSVKQAMGHWLPVWPAFLGQMIGHLAAGGAGQLLPSNVAPGKGIEDTSPSLHTVTFKKRGRWGKGGGKGRGLCREEMGERQY